MNEFYSEKVNKHLDKIISKFKPFEYKFLTPDIIESIKITAYNAIKQELEEIYVELYSTKIQLLDLKFKI